MKVFKCANDLVQHNTHSKTDHIKTDNNSRHIRRPRSGGTRGALHRLSFVCFLTERVWSPERITIFLCLETTSFAHKVQRTQKVRADRAMVTHCHDPGPCTDRAMVTHCHDPGPCTNRERCSLFLASFQIALRVIGTSADTSAEKKKKKKKKIEGWAHSSGAV